MRIGVEEAPGLGQLQAWAKPLTRGLFTSRNHSKLCGCPSQRRIIQQRVPTSFASWARLDARSIDKQTRSPTSKHATRQRKRLWFHACIFTPPLSLSLSLPLHVCIGGSIYTYMYLYTHAHCIYTPRPLQKVLLSQTT